MNAPTLRLSLFIAATALAAACGGDDDGSTPVDARPIDAPSDIDGPNIDAPPAVAGDTCGSAEAVVLAGGTATITATTLGFANDHEPGECAGVNSAGPDRVHSINIPAGNRLTATVDPTAAGFDPGIFLIAAPAANCDVDPPVCLASNDTGGDGADDAITFDNPAGGAAVDAFIIIDGFREVGDAYTLTVTVAALP
jgi:hypothetical protein